MTIKTLLASAALIASASFAQALTLTPGDSGGNFDVLAEGYDFQVSLGDTDGAASYDFTFDNNSASVAAVTISSATIGQLGSFSFFTGGADVTWTGAGTVVAAGEGVDASGSLTFVIAAGASDTLTVTYGDPVVAKNAPNVDIDFRVFATPVPLPAGALLLGTALAGLGYARRRKAAA